MLGNNEKIEGVKFPEVFNQMLRELPWRSLQAYIQSNAVLLKSCTLGGRRFDPQQRAWFEKVVNKEAEKSEFSETITGGLFAAWYPVRVELNKTLEDYFHSDEYKDYRTANNLTEEDYVLSDEKFEAFFQVSQLDAWRILLCFSPLKFTAEQAKKILDGAVGNVELLAQVKDLQDQIAELQKKNAQMTADAEKNRQRIQEDANELQEAKKQLRQSRQDQEQQVRKLESVQAEIKRLQQNAERHDNELASREKELKDGSVKEVARMQGELSRAQNELASWKSRYEEQRQLDRQLEEATKEAERKVRDVQAEIAKVQSDNERLKNFADLVLSRIEWPKVGAAMKMSPTTRRNFNSLVKKLNYEDNVMSIEEAMPEFWSKLIDSEKKLVDKLARSNSEEVMDGNVESYWDGMDMLFAEAQANLEARTFMLTMLHDIFFQTFTAEDLEKPNIPTGKK